LYYLVKLFCIFRFSLLFLLLAEGGRHGVTLAAPLERAVGVEQTWEKGVFDKCDVNAGPRSDEEQILLLVLSLFNVQPF